MYYIYMNVWMYVFIIIIYYYYYVLQYRDDSRWFDVLYHNVKKVNLYHIFNLQWTYQGRCIRLTMLMGQPAWMLKIMSENVNKQIKQWGETLILLCETFIWNAYL